MNIDCGYRHEEQACGHSKAIHERSKPGRAIAMRGVYARGRSVAGIVRNQQPRVALVRLLRQQPPIVRDQVLDTFGVWCRLVRVIANRQIEVQQALGPGAVSVFAVPQSVEIQAEAGEVFADIATGIQSGQSIVEGI